MPRLQESLTLLSLAFNVIKSAASRDPRSWYKDFLDNLIEIDDLLEQIDVSVILIYVPAESEQGPLVNNQNLEYVSTFKAAKTTRLVADFLEITLDDLLFGCENVFSDFGLQIEYDGVPSTSQKYSYITGYIAQRIPQVIAEINTTIQWLHKPILSVSKIVWQSLDEELTDWVLFLFEPNRFDYERWENGLDQGSTVVESREIFFPAVIPLAKLCRIYFSKLSGSNKSQPLIFVGKSMKMEDRQLNLLLDCTDELQLHLIPQLRRVSERWPNDREEAADKLVVLTQARQWLNSWTALFLLAIRKAMDAAGIEYPWPLEFEFDDTVNEDVLMED
ncbi:hypothetical protein PGT21_010272 [Puccinia graminis f. sp. tritici]|uniref:Uncharacterized protein n=1 Tax=Puccinia graminis f. sp. tritici TaxID=56615 RepID=A0A5B0PVL1_PUCGR|nr:hypothetical protein PGT21_010272 [Puccinia graminis f. sp. tritici]KAA1128244.1 hypothetical protein PGTUg99_015193 [Puccinia graminis f. sp. tritici]